MSDLSVRVPCGEWCALLGLVGIAEGAPFCTKGKGHNGPHRLSIVIQQPPYSFTVEWVRS